MGYHPRPLPTVFEKTTIPSVEKRVAELKKLREETSALLDIAARRIRERNGRDLDKFKKGQKVWLEGKNLSLGYPSPKLSPKREGPFEIEEVLGPVTYRLKLPFQWRIHPVFHAGLLSPYKETDVHGPNFLEPPPDIVEGQEEYEVEAIIGHRPKKKNQPPKEYLVSWKGAFELLFLINSEDYDDQITAAVQDNDRLRAFWGSLLFLRGHRRRLNEALAQLDRQAGTFAKAMTNDDDTIQLMGPITVPVPVLDIENLPVHIEIPKDDDEPFPDSEDINPNEPAFFHEIQQTRRRLRRAIVVARGQCLLQTRQRLRLASIANHSNPTDTTNDLTKDPNKLIYPPESSDMRTSDSSGNISNATERARIFPSTSPCTTPPPMLPPTTEQPITAPSSQHNQRFDPANQFNTSDEPVNSGMQIGMGRRRHRRGTGRAAIRKQIEESYAAYNGTDGRGVRVTVCPVCRVEKHCATDCRKYSCPICTKHAPGHVSYDCHDRRRSRRTTKRHHPLGDPTAYDNLTDDIAWDDEIYGDGES
ncbi:hypothetical protein Moror_702 [Moniliophthora roreri MCA 2997]|uniref:Tf2-1-like SH3-like domain-containing protein n=1 Tax=Moniliophthora roreri (strain MCA 2997) TaxID=1381753 RepID=V2WNU8_MONRO|nr:hypothetical protein Moror_702 [Moniliophthora roreri MCA 2997]